MWRLQNFLFGIILIACWSNPSFAQLSPGDLHRAHKHLEGVENCTKCHESGKKLSDAACLDCHKILADRIKNKKGLHAGKGYSQCEKCHIEHQGRNFDLIHWERGVKEFDHSATGYRLQGAHVSLDCRKCHNSKNITGAKALKAAGKDLTRTYMGLSQDCLSCHLDEHRGQMDGSCANCHNMTGWRPAPGFDHNKTAFALSGRHSAVECKKCHIKKNDKPMGDDKEYLKFSGLNYASCTDCHTDVHQGKLGANCRNCHNTTGWRGGQLTGFDHNRTRFQLKGRHKQVKCRACHPAGKSIKIVRFANCADCHNDIHLGQVKDTKGNQVCESCHSVEGFSPSSFTIERHRKTRYPLTESHLAIPCQVCHKKSRNKLPFLFKSLRCEGCHSDPHGGQVSLYLSRKSPGTNKDGCEHCHSIAGWEQIQFDHSQTRFPLNGKHQSITCGQCHSKDSLGRRRITGLSTACRDCHRDIHAGQFAAYSSGKEGYCRRCHQPEGWGNLLFNHNTMSTFNLDGSHAKAACAACHKEDSSLQGARRFKPLASACADCHSGMMQKPNR